MNQPKRFLPVGPLEWGLLLFLVLVLICIAIASIPAQAQVPRGTIKLAWDALPAEQQLTAYRVYWGTSSGNYGQSLEVPGDQLAATVSGLEECTDYFLAVKAANAIGESAQFSNEISGWPRPIVDSIDCADAGGLFVGNVVSPGSTYSCTITGGNFRPSGVVASIVDGSNQIPGVAVTILERQACGQLRVSLELTPTVAAGTYAVRVRNPATDGSALGPFGGRPGGLTVAAAVPGQVPNARRDDS